MKRLAGVQQPRFRLSTAYLLLGSLAVLGIGVVMLWLASRGEDQNVFFASLASALVSVGVVALVTEVMLRNVYTYDLVDLIDADNRAWEVGFSDLSTESDFTWRWLLGRKCSSIRVVLASPASWLERDWPLLLDSARSAQVSIDVYMVNPEDRSLLAMAAEGLGLSVEDLRGSLDRSIREMRTSWQSHRSGPERLHSKSTLSIRPLVKPAPHGLIQCDRRILLLLEPYRLEGAASQRLVAALDDANGRSRWHEYVQATWSRLERQREVPIWTDREPAEGIPVAALAPPQTEEGTR